MGKLKCQALALAMCASFFPLTAVSQPVSPKPPNMIETLNKEAEANDPEGIHAYSQHLIQIVVGNGVSPAYAAALSSRLATAESMARQGRRKLISEADIALAFNNLMKETGAPGLLRANDAAIKEARGAFEIRLPALISRQKNGPYCNPGEAVWVISMLVANVGRSPAPSSQLDHKTHFVAGAPPVQQHLEIFYAKHSQSKVAEAFEHLFNDLQI
jgi:hypothetical protein